MATHQLVWYPGELARFVGASGPIDQALDRAAGRVRDRAKVNINKAGLIDTGQLIQSIRHERAVTVPDKIIYQVGTSVPYARYHETGTGIYGPSGRRIVPLRAKVLRWPSKGAKGGYAFALSVRGVKATGYMKRAAAATSSADFMP